MSRSLSKRMSIFLSIDKATVKDFFNPHDPAPLYKRQLRHDFVDYIEDSVEAYKKYSNVRYKISCSEDDKALIQPVMHAIKRHFHLKEQVKRSEFARFKKGSYQLLFVSMMLVMALQGLIEVSQIKGTGMEPVLHNYADVFSWVVMWQPIYRLVFMWNPYLKEISLLEKLAAADAIIIHNGEEEEVEIVNKLRASA